MTDETLNILFILSPLIIGGIIAATNAEVVNNATESAEAWTRRTQSIVALKNGWFSRYISNPILWIIVKFSDWTDSFTHRGLKNGIRVAATLYLIAAWCLILYATFVIAVVLIISGIVIYIIFKVLFSSNSSFSQGYENGRRIVGSVGSGKRINQDTGRIQKEGMLGGWVDTDERIDPETGNMQKEGLIGWNNTDTRIDQETGNIQKEGFLGYNDTDTRIKPRHWDNPEERSNKLG